MVFRLLDDTFVSQKIESVNFCLCPQAKLSPRQKEITHFTRTAFSENLFFSQQKGGGRLWSWKMTKIKLARVLVTSFDKFHHLCNLHIFGFCFVVSLFRFKHAEVWRFFNLTNNIFTKMYSVQKSLHEK